MSANKRDGGGFNPSGPPRLTAEEFQSIALFFKQFLESTTLKWWIIAAGIGGALEGLHILWLAIRYLAKF
jgi:hypothetical protein